MKNVTTVKEVFPVLLDISSTLKAEATAMVVKIRELAETKFDGTLEVQCDLKDGYIVVCYFTDHEKKEEFLNAYKNV